MTTSTRRTPIFAVPALDQSAPGFTETLRGMVAAGENIARFTSAVNAGRMPDSATIDLTLEAITFFAVPGDKDYAREFLRTCTMVEFAQCVATITTGIHAVINHRVAELAQPASPPAITSAAGVNNGE
jgi:hypothetical protein